MHGLGALSGVAPASWQTNPAALRALVKAAQKSLKGYGGGLGTLGLSPVAGTVGGKVAGTVAGAAVTSAATAGTFGTILASSSVAGPIGLAVGAVIAIAVSLLTKNYFNVNQSNAACAQVQAAWQKYLTIQGHVAGRALGWKTMVVIFHGAVGSGLFPGNDMHLQFHEGTLQCAGHGDWADSFLGQTLQGNPVGCGAHNCMPDALKQFNQGSVPAGTPSAVYFVDSILLPMNQSDKIPWITNGAQNPQVHQLLYDLADAYLAQNSSGTVPYVEYPAAQAGTPTTGAEAAPGAATSAPTSTSATAVASAPTNLPATAAPSGGPIQVGTDPTTGLPVYQVPGQSTLYQLVNGSLVPYAPAQTNPMPTPSGYYQAPAAQSAPVDTTGAAPAGSTGAITTGGFQLSTSGMLLIGGGLLAAFIMSYMSEKGRHAAAKREKK